MIYINNKFNAIASTVVAFILYYALNSVISYLLNYFHITKYIDYSNYISILFTMYLYNLNAKHTINHLKKINKKYKWYINGK